MESSAHIFHLSDECLDMILRNLNRHDMLHFALTCQRFQDIFFHRFPKTTYCYVNCYLDRLWYQSECKVNDFFQLFGKSVRRLIGKSEQENPMIFEVMSKSELQLESIDIAVNIENLKYLFKFLDELEIVDHMKMIKLSKTSHSDYAGPMYFTGTILKKFKNLEHLSLKSFDIPNDGNIIEIVKCMKNLTQLDFNNCNSITENGLKVILENCQQLQRFSIKINPNFPTSAYADIVFMPNLISLKLVDIDFEHNDFLVLLALHKSEQLECLELEDTRTPMDKWTVKLTMKDFSEIAKLKKLNVLRIWEDDLLIVDEQTLNNIDFEKNIVKNAKRICCLTINKTMLLQLMLNCKYSSKFYLYNTSNICNEDIIGVMRVLNEFSDPNYYFLYINSSNAVTSNILHHPFYVSSSFFVIYFKDNLDVIKLPEEYKHYEHMDNDYEEDDDDDDDDEDDDAADDEMRSEVKIEDVENEVD